MKPVEVKIFIAFLVIAAIAPAFISNEFVIHVMIMSFFYAVLASSLNLIVGFVGELPSTSSSTTPASPATACSRACPTTTGAR